LSLENFKDFIVFTAKSLERRRYTGLRLTNDDFDRPFLVPTTTEVDQGSRIFGDVWPDEGKRRHHSLFKGN